MTEEKIQRWIKKGKGTGSLDKYKPWLNIHDVPSTGNSVRIRGWKTNRTHHFLSNIERDYFYLLEWSNIVVDIQEQYPLSREVTYKISESLAIKHPTDVMTKTPIVMTSDFLVSKNINGKNEKFACAIKSSRELENPRTIEKLEIERCFWESKNIRWFIITEKDLPKELVSNIKWVHSYKQLPQEDATATQTFYKYLYNNLNKDILAIDILQQFDSEHAFDIGTGITYFRHLLANKVIEIDMSQKVNLKKLKLASINFVYKGLDNELYSG